MKKTSMILLVMCSAVVFGGLAHGGNLEEYCSNHECTKFTSRGVKWVLKAIKYNYSTERVYQVWKDTRSGLVWGDRLDSLYTHYKAMDGVCTSKEGMRASVGMALGLPKIEEYEDAEANGIRDVLPNLTSYWFWSASLDPSDSAYARGFYGSNGNSDYSGRDVGNSVRCVGR